MEKLVQQYELLSQRTTQISRGKLHCDFNTAHSLAEYSDETLILSEDLPELNELLLSVCRSTGFEPKTRMAPDFETKMLWIEFGQGVGVNSKEHFIKTAPMWISSRCWRSLQSVTR